MNAFRRIIFAFLVCNILHVMMPFKIRVSEDTSKLLEANEKDIQHIECSTNKRYCNESICDVKLVSRDKRLFSVGCNLVKPANNVTIHVTLNYRTTVVYRKFLIDLKENYCDFQNANGSFHLLDMFMPQVYQYGPNFKRGCPLTGNMTFIGMPYNKNLFPHILPSGQYRFDIDVWSENVSVWFIKVFFSVP